MAQKMTTYFNDFLKNIRLTENQVNELKTAHTTLRTRLKSDKDLKDIIETTFLQGSYRRSTAVRPKQGKRSDVDIVVVTRLDKEEVTPEEALDIFEPFLKKYYDGKYRKQGKIMGNRNDPCRFRRGANICTSAGGTGTIREYGSSFR